MEYGPSNDARGVGFTIHPQRNASVCEPARVSQRRGNLILLLMLASQSPRNLDGQPCHMQGVAAGISFCFGLWNMRELVK